MTYCFNGSDKAAIAELQGGGGRYFEMHAQLMASGCGHGRAMTNTTDARTYSADRIGTMLCPIVVDGVDRGKHYKLNRQIL